MIDMLTDFVSQLLAGPFFNIGVGIWNVCMTFTAAILGQDPQELGAGAPWQYIQESIYPIFLAIGFSLMNLLWIIGYCRDNADLKQSMTFQIFGTAILRLIFANGILGVILLLIPQAFSMATNLANGLFSYDEIAEFGDVEISIGAALAYHTTGFFFMVAAIICGITIMFAVYKRFLNLYLLVPMAPLALSGIAGGRGMSNAAYSWIKTFLGCCFEVVVIAVTLNLCMFMLNGFETGIVVPDDFSWITAPLEAIFMMVITAGSVKGAEALLRRGAGL